MQIINKKTNKQINKAEVEEIKKEVKYCYMVSEICKLSLPVGRAKVLNSLVSFFTLFFFCILLILCLEKK